MPVVQAMTAAATRVLQRPAEVAGASYWCDASLIAGAGIPTLIFGPNGDGAHAASEWASISGTVACANTLIEAAKSLCQ
jgi:acetylornithine deacetylase